ncbi:MAG: hypothetical protein JW940_33905 [Polyangiaceae bacterium]|nr:hypothetical protein [Polyangiaceae bacterium]
MPVACLALLAVASLLGSVGCNSDQSKPSGAAAGQTGASTTDPNTIARQGWWRGWFDDASNDFFRFRVEDDEIHDTYFTAAKSNSMCGISVIVSGVQLDDHIVDDRFDYSMRALRFTGEFVDSKHAQITFTAVDDACAVREGGQYDAYWVEDPCDPDIAQIVDLTGGNAGARTVFSVHAEVPKACDDGVPDGTEVTLTLEDPDGTGSSLEQASVRLEDGTATAALLLGESSGTCRVEASVEGIAPSNRSDPITVRGTTASGTGGAGGAPTTGGSAGTSGEQARGGVLLVIDKSDSMASAASGSPPANWDIVVQAVSSVVDSAGPMTRFGLELFPGSAVTPRCNEAACCAMPAPGSMTVPFPASGVTGLAIADALNATTPGGWSPLGDARVPTPTSRRARMWRKAQRYGWSPSVPRTATPSLPAVPKSAFPTWKRSVPQRTAASPMPGNSSVATTPVC